MRVEDGILNGALELDCNCDNLIGFSGEEGIEDAGVDIEERELNECIELPLVEREDDEDEDSSDDPEPCRASGRRGVEVSEGLERRAKGCCREGVPGYESVFEMVDEVDGHRCVATGSVETVSSRR